MSIMSALWTSIEHLLCLTDQSVHHSTCTIPVCEHLAMSRKYKQGSYSDIATLMNEAILRKSCSDVRKVIEQGALKQLARKVNLGK